MKVFDWLDTVRSVPRNSRSHRNLRRFHRQNSRHSDLAAMTEQLEERTLLAAAFPEFIDPNPNSGNQFGATVVSLSTGNVVITSPFDDAGGADAGAVYLFNGATGSLISTLTGTSSGDRVGGGGVTALSNGNFVVRNPNWDNGAATDAGAVTFASGTTTTTTCQAKTVTTRCPGWRATTLSTGEPAMTL